MLRRVTQVSLRPTNAYRALTVIPSSLVRPMTSVRGLASSPSSTTATPIPRPAPPGAAAIGNGGANTSFSHREKLALQALQKIMHPVLKQDIVLSGHVRGVTERDGIVSVTLQLDQQYRHLKLEIARALVVYPWVKSTRVTMDTPAKVGGPDSLDALSGGNKPKPKLARGLKDVKNIIAVHSCKGGVGKSTVAVNLAYSLATMDLPSSSSIPHLKIGIFDADIYGPSLPTMIRPRDSSLRETDDKLLVPVVYEGVKTMSYGYVKTLVRKKTTHGGSTEEKEELRDQSAIMRGPMASGILSQLVTTTDWGDLDYLILDMPPGTGDPVITLCQTLQITGAVVVTTPQKLSFIDVVKGVEMFDKVKVPILGVVENMSYFKCGTCETLHRPFGDGTAYRQALAESHGLRMIYELPILQEISKHSDSGDPIALSAAQETSSVRAAYLDLARGVHASVTSMRHRAATAATGSSVPTVTYDTSRNVLLLHDMPSTSSAADDTAATTNTAAASIEVSPAALRRACRCAACVDEHTGRQILQPRQIRDDVKPLGIQPRGNYAVAIHWSDGHASSIYPFDAIARVAATAAATTAP